MHPRDGGVRFGPQGTGRGRGGAGDGGGDGEREDDAELGLDDPSDPAPPTSIRDRQRRRRNAGRARPDLTAVLSRPEGAEDDEDETEDEGDTPPGPPPARVFVVFRGASWEDPQGGLRESDNIVAVYATEEGARRAVSELRREGGEAEESWYQPYPVQE